jgi:hypothetical protein
MEREIGTSRAKHPPVLVVTNSTNVMVPMIQLQGFASEELAGLTFDLTNANGAISNQPGYMIGAIYDTNHFLYTNVAFKCFDVALANGRNLVTLHAADLAGNVTTTNFNFTLNYSNKPPPVLQLYWPQNGTQIGGSTFTWRGTVSDPTVTLSAEVADGLGDSNVVAGVVERNGTFWVDNIPLFAGTNYLTLSATDIKGNVTITNITNVQSSVAITITSTIGSAMSGTIDLSNYLVWVNGVCATNFIWTGSNYAWTAYNVPVNGNGTVVAQVRAIPMDAADNFGNGTGGGGGINSGPSNPGNPSAPACADEEFNAAQAPQMVYDYGYLAYSEYDFGGSFSETYSETSITSAEWGGIYLSTNCVTDNGSTTYTVYQSSWETNGGGYVFTGTSSICGVSPTLVGSPGAPSIINDAQGRMSDVLASGPPTMGYAAESVSAAATITFHTPGRSTGPPKLWAFSASGIIKYNLFDAGLGITWAYLPYDATTIMGQIISNNCLFVNLPMERRST